MLRSFSLLRVSQCEFQKISLRCAGGAAHAKGKVVDSPHPLFDSDKINTVGALLDQVTDIMPDKDLFHHVEATDRWSYKEANGHIKAISNGFPEAQLPQQKRVAIIQQNDPENLAFRLASLRSGVVPTHIDINKFNEETTLPYFDAIQPRGVLVTPKYDVEKKIEYINSQIPEVQQNWEVGAPLRIERFPDLKILFHTHRSKFYDGWYSIKDLFWYDDAYRTEKPAKVDPKQINEIHFPRFNSEHSYEPMMFTHQSAVQSALNFGSVAPFSEKRVALTGEFSHPEVMTSFLSCFAFGSYVVASTYWFRPSDVLKNVSKEKCSVLVTTPSHLSALLDSPKLSIHKYELETILVINNPKDMAKNSLLKAAKEQFGAQSMQVAFVADGCMSPFLLSEVTDFSDDSKIVLGAPIPNSESKIVANGKLASVGEAGSLRTKGAHTLHGVLGNDKCARLDNDGFLDSTISATLTDKGVFVTDNC